MEQAENDKKNSNNDIVFEIELIRQIEINIDCILTLVKKYCDSPKAASSNSRKWYCNYRAKGAVRPWALER